MQTCKKLAKEGKNQGVRIRDFPPMLVLCIYA